MLTSGAKRGVDPAARRASGLHYLGGVPVESPARKEQCRGLEPRALPWASTRRYGTAAGTCDLWNVRGTHVGPLPLAAQSKHTDLLVRPAPAAAGRKWSMSNRARRCARSSHRRNSDRGDDASGNRSRAEVQQELASRHEEADRLRRQHVERARYEADLAQRRFLKVDRDNRLVADALEADWNEKLRALAAAQEAYEKAKAADASVVTEAERAELMALAADFP